MIRRACLLLLLLPCVLQAQDAGLSLFVVDAKAINRLGDESEEPLYADLYFNMTDRAAIF